MLLPHIDAPCFRHILHPRLLFVHDSFSIIHLDAKGVPGSIGIRIAATRHVECVILMQRSGLDGEK